MKEIIAKDLCFFVNELNLKAKKTYDGFYEVWEVEDEDFEKMCNIKECDWKDSWGMWRSAEGSNMTNPIKRYNINNHYIYAWDGDSRVDMLEECNYNTNHEDYYAEPRKYNDLQDYFSLEIGISQPKNICALAVDLAKINNTTIGKLFKKYIGDNYEKTN